MVAALGTIPGTTVRLPASIPSIAASATSCGDTCASVYRGIAIVSNGRIAFDSDVYHWTGTVSSNGIIQIDTDGITPLPGHKPLKNKTAVSGAIGHASLFNGYCGYGYFRLS